MTFWFIYHATIDGNENAVGDNVIIVFLIIREIIENVVPFCIVQSLCRRSSSLHFFLLRARLVFATCTILVIGWLKHVRLDVARRAGIGDLEFVRIFHSCTNGHILIHGVKSLGAECIVFSVLSGVKVMSFKVRG